MFTITLYVIGTLFFIFYVNLTEIYIGCVILGFAIGADLPVSLASIAEAAPKRVKSKMVQFTTVLWILGAYATIILASITGDMGPVGGKILFIHLCVIGVIVLLLRMTLAESNEWLEMRKASDNFTPAQISADKKVMWMQLFSRPLIMALIATGLFFALSNIATNTNGQFSTYLMTTYGGLTVAQSQYFGLGIGVITILTAIFYMKVSDGVNRMKWFLIAASLCVIAPLIPAIIGVNMFTLVAMNLLTNMGATFAGEPIYKIWSQELFPTLLRSTAQGITIAFTRIVAAVAAVFTPLILSSGPQHLFWMIFVSTVIAMSIGFFWIPKLTRQTRSSVMFRLYAEAKEKRNGLESSSYSVD
jgi:inositol transporter-like SP family MFS transporter